MVLELREGLRSRRSCKRERSTLAAGRQDRNGGGDGTRTRDLRRDRPGVYPGKSKRVPTFRRSEQLGNPLIVGTALCPPMSRRTVPTREGAIENLEINPMGHRSVLRGVTHS